MSCNYYDNKNLCGRILRGAAVVKEMTDISDQLRMGDNQIEVIEEDTEVAYFDTLFLMVNDQEFLIVKRLYLDNGQKFSFKIKLTDTDVTLDDRDPIRYTGKLVVQFMTTGTIYDPAPGNYTSAGAAAASKAEIERTTAKTVKYVLPFRQGRDSLITVDYVADARLAPVLVDKI